MYQHGGDIYTHPHCVDFSSNVNPFGIPASVKEAAGKALEECHHYPDVHCRKLKEAIRKKDGIQKAGIFCGNGAADVIFALVLAARPRKALVLAPGFQEYEQALRSLDCGIVHHTLSEDRGFVPGEELLSDIDSSLDLVFLCNPNNPTGALLPGELLQRIVTGCREKHVLLVVDECFNDFLETPAEHSLMSLTETEPHLFVLKAFTKMYAIPGLRLGYGVTCNEQLLQKMEQVTQPWRVSVPAQAAGVAAAGEAVFAEESRMALLKEKTYLLQVLKELSLLVFGSEANYLFFRGPAELGKKLLKRGFLIRNCSNYRGLGAGYYRIAVRKHEDNEALAAALRKELPAGADAGSGPR